MNLDTSKPIASVSYNGVDVPLDVAPVLLWTNASPTSEFAAQTVNVETGYSAYIIESRTTTSNSDVRKFFLNIGDTATMVHSTSITTASYGRPISSTDTAAVTFGDGKRGGTTSNTHIIPTRIWGVKFTL